MAYNLIVGTARIVRPRRLLHDLPRDRLKVHQIVAGGERGHAVDALQAIGLLGVKGLLLLLDGGHVDLAEVLGRVEVLVQGVGRVDGVELLGRIFAGIFQNDFLATGVFYSISLSHNSGSGSGEHTGQELGDVVRLAVHDDPARVFGVVLGDGRAGQFALAHDWN